MIRKERHGKLKTDEHNNRVWLIDMAQGWRSAYWNPKKINLNIEEYENKLLVVDSCNAVMPTPQR